MTTLCSTEQDYLRRAVDDQLDGATLRPDVMDIMERCITAGRYDRLHRQMARGICGRRDVGWQIIRDIAAIARGEIEL